MNIATLFVAARARKTRAAGLKASKKPVVGARKHRRQKAIRFNSVVIEGLSVKKDFVLTKIRKQLVSSVFTEGEAARLGIP